FLVIPAELAGIRVERHYTRGVEIQVFALIGTGNARGVVKIAARIACAPINQIQIGIERTRQPWSAAAELPAVALPCLVALFARAGHHIPAPRQPSVFHVEGCQVAAMRSIAVVASDDDLVLHHQRRRADVAAALSRIVDRDFPRLAPGLAVERY